MGHVGGEGWGEYQDSSAVRACRKRRKRLHGELLRCDLQANKTSCTSVDLGGSGGSGACSRKAPREKVMSCCKNTLCRRKHRERRRCLLHRPRMCLGLGFRVWGLARCLPCRCTKSIGTDERCRTRPWRAQCAEPVARTPPRSSCSRLSQTASMTSMVTRCDLGVLVSFARISFAPRLMTEKSHPSEGRG